jgi:hypothetical protein
MTGHRTLTQLVDQVGERQAMSRSQKVAKVIGKSILLAGFLVALASVEMSSRFSVLNFSKSDEILQNACNALSAFMVIGMVWAAGSTAVLYASYERLGLIAGVISNGIILFWIYASYTAAFARSSRENNLKMPKMFQTLI